MDNIHAGTMYLAGVKKRMGVKPYALMVGVPARQVGWMSQFGEQIPLPLQGHGSATCPHTGATYSLQGDTLTRAA
jgi:UDP-2-acetamido-3-amino-2,3-dideoxy-glucuronate N-acetyltransferase